jgi:hypothetical protein
MKILKAIPIIVFITCFAIGCGSSGGGGDDLPSTKTTSVSGTVTDINGVPVQGAKVTITSTPVTVTTDSSGNFLAIVEIGNHHISVKVGTEEIYSTDFNCTEEPYPFATITTQYNPNANYPDTDGDGYYSNLDCDDNNANVKPGATETCDGNDNNCDGTTDEGCDCADGSTLICGTDIGECSTGTQTCVNGQWNSCSGEVGPATETCGDGLDQDCNGSDLACPVDFAPTSGFWTGTVIKFNVSEDSQSITDVGSLILKQHLILGPVSLTGCTITRGISGTTSINSQNKFYFSDSDSDSSWSVSGEFDDSSNSHGTWTFYTSYAHDCGYSNISGTWTATPFTPNCEDKPIADVVFADSGLEDCVGSEQSTEICTEELKELDCSSGFGTVTDLGGIDQLTGLEDIDLSDGYFKDNDITDVTPLYSLTGLSSLDLTGNDSIPCSQLDQLDVILGPGVVVRPSDCVLVPPVPGNSIVGTWYFSSFESDNAELITFEPGGIFWYAVYRPNYPEDPGIGFQHGTYSWDAASGELTIMTLDSNTAGDWGVYEHYNHVVTSTLTPQGPDEVVIHSMPKDDTFIAYRLKASTSNPIIGTWLVSPHGQTSGESVGNFMITPDGYYMLINLDGPDDVVGQPGIEYGQYTFNPSSGVFAVTPIADTSEHWGISPDSSQFTLTISSTTMLITSDTTTLHRLEP